MTITTALTCLLSAGVLHSAPVVWVGRWTRTSGLGSRVSGLGSRDPSLSRCNGKPLRPSSRGDERQARIHLLSLSSLGELQEHEAVPPSRWEIYPISKFQLLRCRAVGTLRSYKGLPSSVGCLGSDTLVILVAFLSPSMRSLQLRSRGFAAQLLQLVNTVATSSTANV
jgi:hypothetical protein